MKKLAALLCTGILACGGIDPSTETDFDEAQRVGDDFTFEIDENGPEVTIDRPVGFGRFNNVWNSVKVLTSVDDGIDAVLFTAPGGRRSLDESAPFTVRFNGTKEGVGGQQTIKARARRASDGKYGPETTQNVFVSQYQNNRKCAGTKIGGNRLSPLIRSSDAWNGAEGIGPARSMTLKSGRENRFKIAIIGEGNIRTFSPRIQFANNAPSDLKVSIEGPKGISTNAPY